jgi:tRNA A37 methylthiotransferase MiaB
METNLRVNNSGKIKEAPMKSRSLLKALFISNACEEGRLSVQKLKMFAIESGASITTCVSQADCILFYPCGHLTHNDNEAIEIIKRLNREKKPSSKLIIWGCLPQINLQVIQDIYNGPLIGNDDWEFFADLFNHPKERMDQIYANIPYPRTGTLSLKTRMQIYIFEKLYCYTGKTWHIKIVSGCRYHCTYCTDQLVYKTVKSNPEEDILDQIGKGLEAHIKHFYFVGRDLGSYGYDNGKSLADLLNKIAEKYPNRKFKISLFNIAPNALIDNYPKINPHLLSDNIFQIGSHIQTGSQKILERMGKTLNFDEWKKTMLAIDTDYPNIRLATSLMVGFPGETEYDIQKTLDLLESIPFDRIDLYRYSERPNLPSLQLTNSVPHQGKINRLQRVSKAAKANVLRKRTRKGRLLY